MMNPANWPPRLVRPKPWTLRMVVMFMRLWKEDLRGSYDMIARNRDWNAVWVNRTRANSCAPSFNPKRRGYGVPYRIPRRAVLLTVRCGAKKRSGGLCRAFRVRGLGGSLAKRCRLHGGALSRVRRS